MELMVGSICSHSSSRRKWPNLCRSGGTKGSAHANKERLEGEFEPILMARYSGDRNNFGIKGARVGVYPAGGRKVTKYV